MRFYLSIAAPLALGGCWQPPGAEPAPAGQTVACALDGAEAFEENCTLKNTGAAGEFVIHHPEGGFRRFASDGAGGYAALDGADGVVMGSGDDSGAVRLAIGGDRYLVPLSMLETGR